MFLFCLLAAGWGIQRMIWAAQYQNEYRFDVQHRRLAQARQALGSAVRVGYLTNVVDGERGFTALYAPTQFLMAPTQLIPLALAPDVEWVLGDFTRQLDYAALGESHGLGVLHEYPMGVVIYRRIRPAAEGNGSPGEMQP